MLGPHNQKPHMAKVLRKAIMRRSFYKNKANTSGSIHYNNLYKKQRNIVVNINRKAKRTFFQSCDTNAKSFWNACKPFFSNKSISQDKISLLDNNNNLLTDETQISNIFNSFFVNIARNIGQTKWNPPNDNPISNSISTDDINLIVEKYREHPSIQKIISMDNKPSFSFSFPHVLPLDTYRVIMSLNPKKSVSGLFSIKVIHMISDIITIPLTDCINAAICEGVFPDVLKMAKVTPVFKKGEKNKVGNYRPISIPQRYTNAYYIIICLISLRKYFLHIYVVFALNIVRNMPF